MCNQDLLDRLSSKFESVATLSASIIEFPLSPNNAEIKQQLLRSGIASIIDAAEREV